MNHCFEDTSWLPGLSFKIKTVVCLWQLIRSVIAPLCCADTQVTVAVANAIGRSHLSTVYELISGDYDHWLVVVDLTLNQLRPQAR